ncbi:MAG TPA: Trm112 family protein [Jatrophihabitans sp.]|nr:Trm112 family protein [Jatrophihabitans sp.]
MPLDADLLALLACPSEDHAPLREETRDGTDVLVCSYCAATYRIDDGIPVLLLDEATPGPHGLGKAAAESNGQP